VTVFFIVFVLLVLLLLVLTSPWFAPSFWSRQPPDGWLLALHALATALTLLSLALTTARLIQGVGP